MSQKYEDIQVSLPKKPVGVTAPGKGSSIFPAYARALGQWVYIWAWPIVNQFNRRAAITQAPVPGKLNGVLPVGPRGRIGMLNDYIDPGQTFVTCPNQDVVLAWVSLHWMRNPLSSRCQISASVFGCMPSTMPVQSSSPN